MIKEGVEKILSLRQHTDTETKLQVQGNYSCKAIDAKFNEAEGKYTVRSESYIRRTVSTAKSFSTAIIEEARRRNNKTGDKMTVLFNKVGGQFFPDDDFYAGQYDFERTLSQQWKVLSEIAGRTLDHEKFLFVLQELSPSIQDFHKLYRSFIKVRIIGKSELSSNPVFVDNEAESGFKVKYTLEGGQSDEEVLPQGFICEIPYAKGSDIKYRVPVETMILNNGSDKLVIRINCPILEKVEEEAIFDEVEQIRKDAAELSDLLILESY